MEVVWLLLISWMLVKNVIEKTSVLKQSYAYVCCGGHLYLTIAFAYVSTQCKRFHQSLSQLGRGEHLQYWVVGTWNVFSALVTSAWLASCFTSGHLLEEGYTGPLIRRCTHLRVSQFPVKRSHTRTS